MTRPVLASETAQGVSLDAAGTLIDLTQPVVETYISIASDFSIPLNPVALDAAFRACFSSMPALAFDALEPAALLHQERQWWRTLVRCCTGPQGRHPRFEAYFDALYEYYRGSDAWQLYPEVEDLLGGLHHKGIPVVVTSNFDSRLLDILDGLGVRQDFVGVLYSSRAGSAKPDSGIFAASCRVLGLAPGRVLHAGDDRRADLLGARAAGLQARWLRRSIRPAEPGETISDLRPILGLVSAGADAFGRQT